MRIFSPPEPLTILAPAKLNLGLEVLGRRPDGYHELVTILQTITIVDHILLRPAETLVYRSPPGIPPEQDLLRRAIALLGAELGIELRASVELRKAIPVSAGLGGGSSDAGSLIGALGSTFGIGNQELERLASRLGSDVPFFVRGGTTLAVGTGATLQPLPDLAGIWFLVAVPPLEIEGKTARLYRELVPSDFSDGNLTRVQADTIARAGHLRPELLRNSFQRALLERAPVRRLADELRRLGAEPVLPSGAGPALFTPCASRTEAEALATALPSGLGRALVCTTLSAGAQLLPLSPA